MRFLVDTHTFLWAILSPEKLTDRVRNIFMDRGTELLVSIATPWEMAIKAGIGKLVNGAEVLDNFENLLAAGGYRILETSTRQVIASGSLPLYHKDPFDRLLIAQAFDLNVPILSSDEILDRYGVIRIWK
ncbi:MAG: type II toxin-antitoxin system VapC family toxin [Terracidiphilus sp.]